MKFLVDAQLPPALAFALREIGENAFAVRDFDLREAEDGKIWDYALENEMILITKDEDFSERAIVCKVSPVIVWLRIGNTSNQALLQWLIPLWSEIKYRLDSGDRLIEVREKNH